MASLIIDNRQNVLAQLRRLIPPRAMRFHEALRVAELQASRLLSLSGIDSAAVPSRTVTDLPRISVRTADIPTSGASYWDGQQWVICLNGHEPSTRRRLTLLHEFKHIIDHGRASQLYPGSRTRTAQQQAEQAADFFAGCALVPRMLLKRAWFSGVQDLAQLAAHFEVSQRAVEVRLMQLGLDERPRCSRSIRYDSGRQPIPNDDIAAHLERSNA